jgi:hypothetical protein
MQIELREDRLKRLKQERIQRAREDIRSLRKAEAIHKWKEIGKAEAIRKANSVINQEKFMGFIITRIIAAILLFLALGRHPYGYYEILRLVVCGVTIYGVYFSAKLKKIGWVFTFGIIAILFNPLIPIYLRRGTWQFIDLAVAVLLLLSISLWVEK